MSYYSDFIPDPTVCKRYPYGLEPYVRITLEGGSTVDGEGERVAG